MGSGLGRRSGLPGCIRAFFKREGIYLAVGLRIEKQAALPAVEDDSCDMAARDGRVLSEKG